MELVYFQKGFNYRQDGPGNRLIYHLQGCNLRCLWCTNPEGLEVVKEEMLSGGLFVGEYANCKKITTDELVREALGAKKLFFDGGGVTFTGGEATMQFASLEVVLKELKSKEINCVIETNGTHPKLEALFPWLDTLIIDCKHIDEESHKEATGESNRQILHNIKRAAHSHPNVLIRIPLIHGFNTGEHHRNEFVNFAKMISEDKGQDNKLAFEFLTYHEYGKVKWESRNIPYTMKEGFVPEEELIAFREIFTKNGIPMVST